MTEPRIVSPQEASRPGAWIRGSDLLHTVATEPDRIRAAVAKALRDLASPGIEIETDWVYDRADAIENGADY